MPRYRDIPYWSSYTTVPLTHNCNCLFPIYFLTSNQLSWTEMMILIYLVSHPYYSISIIIHEYMCACVICIIAFSTKLNDSLKSGMTLNDLASNGHRIIL